MSKRNKVEVQKGEIRPDKKTYRWATQSEKVASRVNQLRELRDGQTLKLHTPKQ